MRKIEYTTKFKRDFSREGKGHHRDALKNEFRAVLKSLVNDLLLEEHYRDHALVGDWKDHRDCHIKPDQILIYRFVGNDAVQLVRLGSNSKLGL